MIRRLLLSGLALALLFPAAAAAAPLYRYTDERGTVHFVSSPEEAPAKYRERLRAVTGNVTTVPGIKSAAVSGGGTAAAVPEIGPTPTSPLLIVAVEFWRSRIWIGAILALMLGAGLALGLRLGRDLPAGGRRRLKLKFVLSFAAALGLCWLALLGPETARFLRGVEADAGSALGGLAAGSEARGERLSRLAALSGRAAAVAEKLTIVPKN
jgi:hypothetical protein